MNKRIEKTKANLIACCPSLEGRLEALTDAEIEELDTVDTGWCAVDWERNYFTSMESAVSAALFSQYDEIIERK